MSKRIVYVLFLALSIPHCKKKILVKKHLAVRSLKASTTTVSPPPITVWIHGTRFFRHAMYSHVFKRTPALKPACQIDPYYHAYKIAHTLSRNASYPFQTFYVFGWSGKLSAQGRHEAAAALHRDLKRVCQAYQEEHGVKPVVKIITHSHGGNVALNLAQINEQEAAAERLAVAQLILLACPVQASTMHLVESPCFAQVYSFYSSLDLVQRLAPQMRDKMSTLKNGRLHRQIRIPPFSEKRFPAYPKLVQAKLKINGRSLFHGDFTTVNFMKALGWLVDPVYDHLYSRGEQDERLIMISV